MELRAGMRDLCRYALALLLLIGSVRFAVAEVTFGVFGDTPYGTVEALAAERMIHEINREPLAFTVHVGDFKSGSSPCSDEVYRKQRAFMDLARTPLVYLPGDNDWVDCHRKGAGEYDPLERLRMLREVFFRDRLHRGSGKLALQSQRDQAGTHCRACVEHLRWRAGTVLFVTLNVQGSNNNLGRNPAMDLEHAQRAGAVGAWLDSALVEATRQLTDAMVIFIHANPFFERTEPGRPPRRLPDGFDSFRRQLAQLAQRFTRPVLVIHGDSHSFQDNRPLYDPVTREHIPNVRRVEVFGSPIVNWIKVTVRPGTAEPFEIRPAIAQRLAE
jgi:hypothetical protein